ncbi:MAG: 16S rRNA (cytosine(967)-C(5))-methyltransferase RsmB [Myxococcaceae bacterium]|nr:16S rRNA (cytosine(967)-C(5))-methyltransferase RsmB [Myxococcaceae bacterium]
MSPRALAIEVLARVRATDAFLNVVLDSALDEHRPDARDAGLVTELVYGSTRRQLQLDEAIAAHADRKLDAIEDRVLAALRIGAYQRFYLRVPPHAAVAATVDAVKEVGLHRATGFVNALLRKLGDTPPAGHSHPAWLAERWARHFGPERAAAMIEADNLTPPVVARVNTTRTTRDEVLASLPGAKATTVSPLGVVLPPGQPEELLGFSEGLWQVQDEAAQLVGLYAAVPKGARVLDACAAPGGKSCHLAAEHDVVALDVHANKLDKIRREAARLGLKVDVRQGDASKLPESLGEFDAVLLDAPCSGLGTLRRHPELRYRRKAEDIPRLASLQRAMLQSASERVKPGGLLVYAVCTTEPEEGADQIELFLRSHPDFTAEAPPSSGVPFPTWQAYLRTLPGPEGMDGFFAARLRRMY